METFFSLLQKNLVNTRRWDTLEDLRFDRELDRDESTTASVVSEAQADPGRI
jgi:hypothetical protein